MPSLSAISWTCSCCGQVLEGLPPAMAFAAPDNWTYLDVAQKNEQNIDSDFCLIKSADGNEHYIRCVLPFEIAGTGEAFEFGVWMSVSEASWHIYREGFDTRNYQSEGCFGYLSNRIAGFSDTINLPADVYFGKNNQRPRVQLHESEHPLVLAQINGLQLSAVENLASRMHRGGP
jgi:hypothetical protein